jgi:hypothetical protein
MIRAHFGLEKPPFSSDSVELLPHQQDVLDTLRVHSQQGGLCLIVGEPGTGKSLNTTWLPEKCPPNRAWLPHLFTMGASCGMTPASRRTCIHSSNTGLPSSPSPTRYTPSIRTSKEQYSSSKLGSLDSLIETA